MALVLDTSALVEIERRARAGKAIEGLLPWDEEIILPAIVWAEALVGVRLAGSATVAARRQSRLDGLLARAGVEPFTATTAAHCADIVADLTARGCLIPQNDIAVGGTRPDLSPRPSGCLGPP